MLTDRLADTTSTGDGWSPASPG
uniref:Uncharacterized protein n=1 Tax=Arundo donax TaxID=35708 RepID=A0A0A9TXD4_ARUDO